MPAGVHHPDVLAGGVLGFDVTGIGHAGLLDDGQRIHVGTNQQSRAGTVLQYRHQPVSLCSVRISSHPFRDRVAGLA